MKMSKNMWYIAVAVVAVLILYFWFHKSKDDAAPDSTSDASSGAHGAVVGKKDIIQPVPKRSQDGKLYPTNPSSPETDDAKWGAMKHSRAKRPGYLIP